MVVTEVVASEDVGEVSVGETVAAMEVVVEAADSEVATKWEGGRLKPYFYLFALYTFCTDLPMIPVSLLM